MSTMNLTFSEFDSYKLTTEFSGDCYTHTIPCEVGVKTEKWSRTKQIGRGAFGMVWKERCVQSGALRAVKQIRKSDIKDTGEVLALTRMNLYPRHFVQFFGWFRDDESVYLAMEYVECGDLGQLILEDELSERDIKLVATQLLEGLKVMHENGFCHRDLKPQNVLVSKWIPITVKISDFGIAKYVGDKTELRTFAGSPGYAAPEIWGYLRSDTSVYTNAVDIWSLGCLVYAMITKETPFPEVKELLDYIDALAPFPEAKLRDRASTAIELITSLMRPNPHDRLTAEQALNHPWFGIENGDAQTFWMELPSAVVSVKPEQGRNQNPAAPAKPISEQHPNPAPAKPTSEQSPNTVVAAKPELKKNPVKSNGHGQALIMAAKGGHLELVQFLLAEGADTTATDENGFTPLHWAAQNGHLEMVQSLLEKGAEVTTRSKMNNTPLSIAAEKGHTEVVRFLLEKGADAMERTSKGYTTLHWAAQNRHLEVAQLLLERGVDITAMDEYGFTPLHWAAQNGHLEMVQSLLEKGADVTTRSKRNSTPLSIAAENGHTEMVRFLLEKGADAMERVSKGYTTLHWAAQFGRLEVAQLLLERGVDITATDENGFTPLDQAANCGHLEMVQFLLRAGTDKTPTDTHGAFVDEEIIAAKKQENENTLAADVGSLKGSVVVGGATSREGEIPVAGGMFWGLWSRGHQLLVEKIGLLR